MHGADFTAGFNFFGFLECFIYCLSKIILNGAPLPTISIDSNFDSLNKNFTTDQSRAVSVLLKLIVLVVFIYYVTKNKSTDGIILLISSVMSLLFQPCFQEVLVC